MGTVFQIPWTFFPEYEAGAKTWKGAAGIGQMTKDGKEAGGLPVQKKSSGMGLDLSLIHIYLLPGEHPIVPVMLYDPKVANEFASRMLEKGVYVVGFCYPVVPKGRDVYKRQA